MCSVELLCVVCYLPSLVCRVLMTQCDRASSSLPFPSWSLEVIMSSGPYWNWRVCNYAHTLFSTYPYISTGRRWEPNDKICYALPVQPIVYKSYSSSYNTEWPFYYTWVPSASCFVMVRVPSASCFVMVKLSILVYPCLLLSIAWAYDMWTRCYFLCGHVIG